MSLSILAAVTMINDATMLLSAITPLVKQAMDNGDTEITDADVAAARAKLVSNVDVLDAAISKAKAEGR